MGLRSLSVRFSYLFPPGRTNMRPLHSLRPLISSPARRSKSNRRVVKLTRVIILLILPVMVLSLGAAAAASLRPLSPFALLGPNVVTTARFAVIGDYGSAGSDEADVATLIRSWNPDFITTTGDNNYDAGCADT